MVTVLETPLLRVDKIFHLADIHIRNFRRHDEYREVFQRTYEYIKENKGPSSIIYIAGDLVHSKTELSPELVHLLSNFLTDMADLCPTIVILGNHDTNLNNKARLDTLTPIIEVLKNPNIYYLNRNGYYKFAQLGINLLEIGSDPEEYFPIDGIQNEEVKIAFYHGAVDGAKTDLNIQLKNDKVKVSTFKGYDYALLGDIHKRQFLSTEPYVAYPSSLLQQNHGESLKGHGLLEWNLEKKTVKEVNIPNDYGYVTLEVENGEIINWDDSFPKKMRVRVRYKNTSLDQRKLIETAVRQKRNVLEWVIQSQTDKVDRERETFVVKNVRDIEYQNELLEQYFENDPSVTQNTLDYLRSINREVNTKIDTSIITRNVTWKPISFEFSNMFSYGEGNKIDFERMNGTYGVFAPNAMGKSSIFDALCFCIYDKCSKTSKASEVLNKDKDSFNCSFKFELQGTYYQIDKVGKKYGKDGNVKVDIDFYYLKEDGEKVVLNGLQRDATTKAIRDYIGTYEDLILTALSIQNNSSTFIEKTQKERRELLADFFDINVFEDLYKIGSEDIKETKALVKSLMSKNINENISQIITLAEEESVKLDELRGNLTQFKTQKETKQKEKESLLLELKTVDESLNELQLEGQIKNKHSELETIQNEIGASEEKMAVFEKKLQEDLATLTGSLTEEQITTIDEIVKGLNDKLLEKTKEEYSTKSEKQTLESQIKFAKQKIEHLKTHEYDPNCQYCIRHNIVQEGKQAEITLQELQIKLNNVENTSQALNSERESLQSEIKKAEESKKQVTFFKSNVQYFKDMKSSVEKMILKKELLNENLLSLLNKYQEAKNQENLRKHNETIHSKVSSISQEIKNLNSQEDILNQTIEQSLRRLTKYQNDIESFERDLQQLKDLDEKYQAYELYLKAVKSSGIPYMIIQKALPTLQLEVNNLLHQIVDFEVRFESDDKNIDAFITYQGDSVWPLELTSGMEKFITSLGIRSALIKSTTLPKPNFLCIDEGFGVLDSEHLAGMSTLFELLKSEFDIVMCISHLDTMKDVVDSRIEVHKREGFSYVNY
jgi:DNA repair exonuclease SbcCD ATPase subunit